jgi:hypothetical protein
LIFFRKVSRCEIVDCDTSKVVDADRQVGYLKIEAKYLRKITNRSNIADLNLMFSKKENDPIFAFDEASILEVQR